MVSEQLAYFKYLIFLIFNIYEAIKNLLHLVLTKALFEVKNFTACSLFLEQEFEIVIMLSNNTFGKSFPNHK